MTSSVNQHRILKTDKTLGLFGFYKDKAIDIAFVSVDGYMRINQVISLNFIYSHKLTHCQRSLTDSKEDNDNSDFIHSQIYETEKSDYEEDASVTDLLHTNPFSLFQMTSAVT